MTARELHLARGQLELLRGTCEAIERQLVHQVGVVSEVEQRAGVDTTELSASLAIAKAHVSDAKAQAVELAAKVAAVAPEAA